MAEEDAHTAGYKGISLVIRDAKIHRYCGRQYRMDKGGFLRIKEASYGEGDGKVAWNGPKIPAYPGVCG